MEELMKVKSLLIVGLSSLALVACGEQSKIEDAVKQQLKDPGSATFKDLVISSDEHEACILWNAKNSLGGYGDWAVARLTNENSQWVVFNMQLSDQQIRDYCTDQQMESNAHLRKTMEDFRNLKP